VRQNHPEIRNSISLKQFVAYPHVALAAGALRISTIEMAVEKALRERRIRRTIGVRVPDLLISSAVVAETDYVAVIPEPIARRFKTMMGLTILALPLPLPDPKILMIWHERSHRDPQAPLVAAPDPSARKGALAARSRPAVAASCCTSARHHQLCR
jgi:DNA-binding transcriptional LysR family regulator